MFAIFRLILRKRDSVLFKVDLVIGECDHVSVCITGVWGWFLYVSGKQQYEFCWIEPDFDCSRTFPIELEPSGVFCFDTFSIGEV